MNMSTAVRKDDLQLMAEYDFKTPINATVIIDDDSDEQNTSLIPNEQYNDAAKYEQRTVCDITFSDGSIETSKTNYVTANTSKKRTLNESETSSDKVKDTENVSNDRNNEFSFDKQLKECQSSNSNQIVTATCTRTTVPQKEDINEKASICLKSILDTVSTHMIFIMQAYTDYRVMAGRTSDRAILDIAKRHYQDAKSRLFYVSFSTVSNILLPKENDKAFIENFINNTVKIANSKHLYFKHSDMTLLCAEMFTWTKSYSRHPILSELLNNESQPTLTSKTSYKNKQDSNKAINVSDNTYVFRSGLVSTIAQSSQNTIPDPTQNVPVRLSEPRNNASSTNYIQEFTNFNTSNRSDFLKQMCKVSKRNRQGQFKKKQPERHHPTLLPPPQCHSTHSWQYETAIPQFLSGYQVKSQFYNNFQEDQSKVEENRSLSRDSGFVSPPSLDFIDQTCSSSSYNHYIDSSSTSITPLITHVTSLNPSVSFIKDGICHVCGKLTKQKCLGCYKFYYCSHQCQIYDWKHHVSACK